MSSRMPAWGIGRIPVNLTMPRSNSMVEMVTSAMSATFIESQRRAVLGVERNRLVTRDDLRIQPKSSQLPKDAHQIGSPINQDRWHGLSRAQKGSK
jgi:hypothetical protein